MKFSSPIHFNDDTGILNTQDTIIGINKTLNNELRELLRTAD